MTVAAGACIAGGSERVAAKTPGVVTCYRDICHRVRTLDEMKAAVGTTVVLETSYYDDPRIDRFVRGHWTSSGEYFDPRSPARAASAQFPDGTELLLRNPNNGRTAHVRVNDFGPFMAARLLDVTRRVAEDLAFVGRGVARLEVTVLAPPPSGEPNYRFNRVWPAVPGFIGTYDKVQADTMIAALQERHRTGMVADVLAAAVSPVMVPALPVIVAMAPPAPTAGASGGGREFERGIAPTTLPTPAIEIAATPATKGATVSPPLAIPAPPVTASTGNAPVVTAPPPVSSPPAGAIAEISSQAVPPVIVAMADVAAATDDAATAEIAAVATAQPVVVASAAPANSPGRHEPGPAYKVTAIPTSEGESGRSADTYLAITAFGMLSMAALAFAGWRRKGAGGSSNDGGPTDGTSIADASTPVAVEAETDMPVATTAASVVPMGTETPATTIASDVISPAAAVAMPGASIIPAGLVITGSVIGGIGAAIVIRGEVLGDVDAAIVEVGSGGRVEGDIRGGDVAIHGRVDGTVTTGTLRLGATGALVGKATAQAIEITEGAVFEAEAHIGRRSR